MIDRSYGVIPYTVNAEGVIRFLILREARGAQHWMFPRGHPHRGESPKETALRELKEETGLVPKGDLEGTFITQKFITYQGELVVERRIGLLIARFDDTQEISLQREEVREYRWVTLQELIDIVSFDELKRVAREAYRLIRS